MPFHPSLLNADLARERIRAAARRTQGVRVVRPASPPVGGRPGPADATTTKGPSACPAPSLEGSSALGVGGKG